MKKMIPMAEPLLNGNELRYLKECVKSGWISSIGKYVKRFEEAFAAYLDCRHAVAVHNGTVALHLALAAMGVGQGDEVIIPTLTFAATANAVLYTGAKPVLVDVEEDTWNINPDLVEKAISGKTKAIIPVHLYGHPCDMDRIVGIAQEYNVAIIEDAAEAMGAEYKGRKVGGTGTVGCFSFFANKIITTGEGGMCTCNDPFITEKMVKLKDHGMRKTKRYWHDEVGFNYRMTNLQAAVGVAQLERIDRFLAKKRENAQMYNFYLSEIDELILPTEKKWAKSSYWMYSILVKKNSRVSRNKLMAYLGKKGIETRPVFYPLHRMPPYTVDGSFRNAEYISALGLSLPSAVTIKEEQVEYVSKMIKKCLRS